MGRSITICRASRFLKPEVGPPLIFYWWWIILAVVLIQRNKPRWVAIILVTLVYFTSLLGRFVFMALDN
jgi:hypothetical protein